MKTKFVDYLNEAKDIFNIKEYIISDNELYIYGIKNIDITEHIYPYSDILTEINLDNCTNCNIESIDYSRFKKLESLILNGSIYNSKIPTIKHNNLTLFSFGDFNIKSDKKFDNDCLHYLPNLTSLNLSNNELTSLPDLSKCSQLKELHVYQNELTYIPSLDNCKNIKVMYLSNNKLTSLPDLSYHNLIEFACDNNKLTSYVDVYNIIKHHTNLNVIYYSNQNTSKLETIFINDIASNSLQYTESKYSYWDALFKYSVDKKINIIKFGEVNWPVNFFDKLKKQQLTEDEKVYIRKHENHKKIVNSSEELFDFGDI